MKKNNFWEQLPRPILALAPMAGVGDAAFRKICSDFGADVVYSEMANVTALLHQPQKTLEMLRSFPGQAPYVVQLFGSKPEEFAGAVQLVADEDRVRKHGISHYVAPDGIDINLGCPVPKIAKSGSGAELMKNMERAVEVMDKAVKNTDLPISIKTRTRAGDTHIKELITRIKNVGIKAVMIHGRTLSQGFTGDIDIQTIREVNEVFDGPVLANGGINNKDKADFVLQETGAAGVGIARGAMGNPWIFQRIKDPNSVPDAVSGAEIKKTALQHADLTYRLKGERGIIEMRKHLCWYVSGLPGASKIREKLIKINSIEDINNIFNEFVIFNQ